MFLQHTSPVVRGLYQDICQVPEDDAPRLILADWLEENGDEFERGFAGFVRFQVALAKGRAEWDASKFRPDKHWVWMNRLAARPRWSLALHVHMRGPIRALLYATRSFTELRFSRGFPGGVYLSGNVETIRLHLPALVRLYPLENVWLPLGYCGPRASDPLAQAWELPRGHGDWKRIGVESPLRMIGARGVPKFKRMISQQVLAWAREQNRKEDTR